MPDTTAPGPTKSVIVHEAKRERRSQAEASRVRSQQQQQQGMRRSGSAAAPAADGATLIETGAGLAAKLSAAPSASSGPPLSESKADAVLAAGAAQLASIAPDYKENDSDEEALEAFSDMPMTEKQRAKELSKISGRISELLGEFEGAGDDDGSADLNRIKEGITMIAATLRKKSLMRSAFLQSAAQQLSKSKQIDAALLAGSGQGGAGARDDDDDDGDERGGPPAAGGAEEDDDNAGLAIEEMKQTETLKKQKLASAHKQAVGMLRTFASALEVQMAEQQRVLEKERVSAADGPRRPTTAHNGPQWPTMAARKLLMAA